jgi:hypothetical protein
MRLDSNASFPGRQRMNAPSHECLGPVPCLARLGERHVWEPPNRVDLGSAVQPVPVAPEFAATGLHRQKQAAAVAELVGPSCSFGGDNCLSG